MAAITNVVRLPIRAYHGHAIFVPSKMQSIKIQLTIIPTRACISRARFRNAPTRNTPSIGPLMSDATDNARESADSPDLIKIIATTI